MLNLMRKYANSMIIKVVLWTVVAAFIGTIFLVWGRGRKSLDTLLLATVNGTRITVSEYSNEYNRLYDFYKRMYQGDVEELIKKLDIKQAALNNLITRKILILNAINEGITVSDSEIVERIESYDAFKTGGEFDRGKYINILRANRYTPHRFEEEQRNDLMIAKLRSIIESAVKITDTELLERYTMEHEKGRIKYIEFKGDTYVNTVTTTEDELTDFYNKNKEAFLVPENYRIDYVLVTPSSLEKKVEISDGEIEDYYYDTIENYEQEERVRARHILFKLSPGADEKTKETIRKKAQKVLERIKSGADFSEMSKKYSDDTSVKDKGGDLGFFKRGEMVKEFEDAAFSLEPGEVSDLVTSPFGIHIIKVEEKTEAGAKPLEEVKDDIIQEVKKSKSVTEAESLADKIVYEIRQNKLDLQNEASTHALEVHHSDFFSVKQGIAGMPETSLFIAHIKDLAPGDVSDPIKTTKGYYVCLLKDKKPSYIPELSEVKDDVEKALKKEKSIHYAEDMAKKVLERLKNGENLDAVAKDNALEIKESDYFTHGGTIPGIGKSSDISVAAFHMTENEYRLEVTPGSFFVYTLLEKKEIDREKFEKDKNEYLKKQLSQKRPRIFNEWVERIKAGAEIKIYNEI